MAVIGYRQIIDGDGVSGSYGESHVYKRAWMIQVDDPTTSRQLIAQAPGVGYGTAHPDQADCKAMSFDCSPADRSGLWWTLSVSYKRPDPAQTPDPATGFPKPVWSASGSNSTHPAYKDKDGATICNSAGDPLEGLEKEENDYSITLTKSYADVSWWTDAQSKSNTVNSDTWGGSAARTWKCSFRGAQKKTLTFTLSGTTANIDYWEVSWEFTYRADTWAIKPWDIGYQQLCTSDGTPSSSGTLRRPVLGQDGKAVKQPVALASGVAKAAGQKPDVINSGAGAKIYSETAFTSYFGTPS
jgi:hypothetical protein